MFTDQGKKYLRKKYRIDDKSVEVSGRLDIRVLSIESGHARVQVSIVNDKNEKLYVFAPNIIHENQTLLIDNIKIMMEAYLSPY